MAKELGKKNQKPKKPEVKPEDKQETAEPVPYESKKTLSEDLNLSREQVDAQYMVLYQQMQQIDTDYVGYVSCVTDMENAANGGNQMDAMNRFYHFQMLASCVQPFMEGLSADSISRAGGTFLGAYICSKNFRKMIKEDFVEGHDQRKAQKQLARLDRQKEKYRDGLPPDKQAKHDALVAKLNGGRMPFSPKSAALTHFGFAMKAYNDMRLPGANVDLIEKNYNKAVESLYKTAVADGCSAQDIAKNFRTAVGVAAEQNPAINTMFSETCYGGCKPVVRKETKTIMSENGPVNAVSERVFDGGYETADGKPINGIFHIRRPQTMNEHIDEFHQKVADAFAKSEGDGFALAHRYTDLCKDASVWQAAISDDVPNEQLAGLQYDQIYSMSEQWVNEALSGDTPQMRERQKSLDVDSGAYEDEERSFAKIWDEVNEKYDDKLKSLENKHRREGASLKNKMTTAKNDVQKESIREMIGAEKESYEHDKAMLEKARVKEMEEKTKAIIEEQERRKTEQKDINETKNRFGMEFLEGMRQLNPNAGSIVEARRQTMEKSSADVAPLKPHDYGYDYDFTVETEETDDDFEL